MDKDFFIIYDVRGIQKYIFKTTKLKEIIGASNIIRNILDCAISEYYKNNKECLINNWTTKEGNLGNSCFEFIKNKNIKAEYVYYGAGNLLLAFRGDEKELRKFNDFLQEYVLLHSYSLSLAYAYVEIDCSKGSKEYLEKRREVINKLNEVKTRMPELVLEKSLPITKSDSLTGLPISDSFAYIKKYIKEYSASERYMPIESALKVMNNEKNGVDELDRIFDGERDSKKRMLAVVHIDGNDMAAMISNYIKALEDRNLQGITFEDAVYNSRNISAKIDYVFRKKVRDILKKHDKESRLVISSGDDITFIVLAEKAIDLVKEIMESIEDEYLIPYDKDGKEIDAELKENRFSSCAGICFIHSHFPFSTAYSIAEESCSIAKAEAKKACNKISTGLKDKNNNCYSRPASFMDFEICDVGVVAKIEEDRRINSKLYLKPYCVSKSSEKNERHIESLIQKIKIFKSDNTSDGSNHRSVAKEIRNGYEISDPYMNILFEKLKSRKPYGEDFMYEARCEDGVAKYYDATSIIDLYDIEKEN